MPCSGSVIISFESIQDSGNKQHRSNVAGARERPAAQAGGPSKRKKLSENGHPGPRNCVNTGNGNRTLVSVTNSPQPPPKVLTARKRTKNGVLKAPTELWLV